MLYDSFIRGSMPFYPDGVLNGQMSIDVDVAQGQDGRTLITISRPVL